MNYYKKTGTRSEEEQALLQAIEAVIEEKGINRKDIPECHSLDDLVEVKHLVDAYIIPIEENPIVETSEINEPEVEKAAEVEEVAEVEEPEELREESEALELTPEIEPEAVESTISEPIEPPKEDQEQIDFEEVEDTPLDFDSGDYDPFASQIIERSYSGGDELEPLPDHVDSNSLENDLNLEESKDGLPFSSPEERTKKKAAEQTADTILKGYARLVPKPFKWLSKFSESRIEKLSFAGQLDLTIEVSPGVTFDDYVKQTNEQVDEIFEVDEDTLEEIREPLVEVLMEQQLELTPQQRLGMAVLSHLMQMFTISMKLRSQNNRILAYQKEMTRLTRTNVA